MKRSWMIAFSVFLFQFSVRAVESPPIRVRLHSALEKIELEGLGVQIRGREKPFEFVAIPQKQKIEITLDEMAGHPIWRVSRNGQTEIFTDRNLVLKAIDLRRQGKSLPSQIFLVPQKMKFDVIGVLPLESYLVGVIASEMPLAWPIETLKAQAIAARSYALATMKERSKQAYHIESTILDQVFTHIGNGPDNHPLVAKAQEAVKATEGYILYTDNSKVLKAFYHSDCGGKTTSPQAVWGRGPASGVAVDSSCPNSPRAHWSLELKEEKLTERLRAYLKKPAAGPLKALQVLRASAQDRVEKIQLAFAGGETVTVSSQDFRAAVGFDQLRSTFFDVKKIDGEYQFRGQGFGHGVGLCQWGARHLGKEGQGFGEILAHYYPKARLAQSNLKILADAGVKNLQELEAQTE